MLTIHILKTEDTAPVPSNIEIIKIFDRITICTPNGEFVSGDHVLVKGSPDHLKQWADHSNSWWLGLGSPAMQQFQNTKT